MADGLRTFLGDITFPIIRQHVSEIVTESEEAIVAAIRSIWERMKIIIELSSAVPVAALFEYPDLFYEQRIFRRHRFSGLSEYGAARRGGVDCPWLLSTSVGGHADDGADPFHRGLVPRGRDEYSGGHRPAGAQRHMGRPGGRGRDSRRRTALCGLNEQTQSPHGSGVAD